MLQKGSTIPGLLLLIALAAPALRAVPGQQQPPPPQSENMPFTVAGKIVKAEAGKITLGTEENIVFYVRYDEKTQITRADGSAGKESDLRAGVHISVKGELNENGDVIAKTIRIEPEKTKS
jgi:hypothetical protein